MAPLPPSCPLRNKQRNKNGGTKVLLEATSWNVKKNMKAVYIKIHNIDTWYIDCFPFMYWFCFPPCIFYHLLFFYYTFSDWCCIVAMKKGVFIFLFKHICCHCIVAAIEIVFFQRSSPPYFGKGQHRWFFPSSSPPSLSSVWPVRCTQHWHSRSYGIF